MREEAARGLGATEDLWAAGSFESDLGAGESVSVLASTRLDGELDASGVAIAAARARTVRVIAASRPDDDTDRLLAIAADQFVVAGAGVPAVVAGYPWFGAWSRDTMTSYEGLFLSTGRIEEGRALLAAAADTISEGMLANTADTGTLEYNTADGTLWFLHALGRHVARSGDLDLLATIMPAIVEIVDRHVAGTRYHIGVDAGDGLLVQGEDGLALTWMDARIDGVAVTARIGKAVDINALWINGLRTVIDIRQKLGQPTSALESLSSLATRSFAQRFVRTDGQGLYDVVDGLHGDDAAIRPNQLLALSLPFGPGGPRSIVDVCRAHLLTPLGLRSLSPHDSRFVGRHRGNSVQRDSAYHQGTIWPWLLGPYRDACRAVGVDPDDGSIDLHLNEWGLGSVSETADGDAPFDGTGCPFQAWSVAEVLRTSKPA
jgi:predicted glycogen debranching enzyme